MHFPSLPVSLSDIGILRTQNRRTILTMNRIRIGTSVLALLGLAVTALSTQAQTAYAINNLGRTLIRFDLTSPGTFTTIGNFTGAAVNLSGIDFRPANGMLYGYSSLDDLVTVNLATAATTFASTPSTPSTSGNLGLDFNPVPDRLRLVNSADQNLRINVGTGATIVDGTLAYGAADPNFGANPRINEAAYTNNDNDPGTGTTLYYIDTNLDIIATTTNPNAGVLATVGSLGVNTDDITGFDIFTATANNNSAYALLGVGGTTGLYSINLGTGAATPLGALAGDNLVIGAYSLAIVPGSVPEPGTFALLAGAGVVGLALRRKIRK